MDKQSRVKKADHLRMSYEPVSKNNILVKDSRLSVNHIESAKNSIDESSGFFKTRVDIYDGLSNNSRAKLASSLEKRTKMPHIYGMTSKNTRRVLQSMGHDSALSSAVASEWINSKVDMRRRSIETANMTAKRRVLASSCASKAPTRLFSPMTSEKGSLNKVQINQLLSDASVRFGRAKIN